MLSLVTGLGDPQEPRVTRPATYGGNGGELTLLLYLITVRSKSPFEFHQLFIQKDESVPEERS